MECSHGTCTHFWIAPRDAERCGPTRCSCAPTASENRVAPVAAGTDQASAKDEDLRRTVIGAVELAAQMQSSDLKACPEADGSVNSSPRHQTLSGRPAYGEQVSAFMSL